MSKLQLGLFEEATPGPEPDANGFLPPDILAECFPASATAAALSVTNYNGYAARALMAFHSIDEDFSDFDAAATARRVNDILRGIASLKPVPTVESIATAAEKLRASRKEKA